MTDKMSPEELAKYDAEYGNTEPADDEGGGGFDPVPDGDYKAAVEEAGVVKSKSGKPMVKIQLRIFGDSFGGRMLWKYAVLVGNALPYSKKDLATMGIEVGKLSLLPAALAKVVGATLKVAVRNKDDNQNVYINGVAEAAPVVDDSQFPFD